MLLNHTMFPVRPARKIGESLAGYAYRLHDANGHRAPQELHSAFAALYNNADHERKQQAAEVIRHVVGAFTDSDWPFWPQRHGWIRQTYAGVRMCPHCIQASGYHQALWELPLVETCPIHKCVLITDCACGRAISWRALRSEWRCLCGRSIQSDRPPPAGKGSVSLARLIFACSKVDSINDWQVTPHVSSELAKLSLQDAYQQISYAHKLASVFLQLTSTHQESPGEVVGALFTDWPHGFEKWLHKWLRSRFSFHDSDSVSVFHSYSPIARCWSHVVHSDKDAMPPSLTHREARSFLEQFVLPLTFDDIAVIHPGLSEKDRKATLDRINHWLAQFRSMVNHLDGTYPTQQKRTNAALRKSSDRLRRVLRFILGRQLTAAARGDDPADVRRIAQVWPPITRSDHLNGLADLRSLIEPLESATATHLAYLEELCAELIEEGELWAMPVGKL